jgi:Tfp pilus assembly protein PilN
MIAPNLASRPHLNTRPVWVVTIVSAVMILVFAAANLKVWMTSSRALKEQLVLKSQLEEEHRVLAAEVGEHIDHLNRVPWRSLTARVNAVNGVIREHEFSWIELLDDIEGVLPYDVRLIKISPKVDVDSVSLSLTAIGRSRDALLDFLDNLIADPKFSDPTPRSEITPEESGVGYVLMLLVEHGPVEVDS